MAISTTSPTAARRARLYLAGAEYRHHRPDQRQLQSQLQRPGRRLHHRADDQPGELCRRRDPGLGSIGADRTAGTVDDGGDYFELITDSALQSGSGADPERLDLVLTLTSSEVLGTGTEVALRLPADLDIPPGATPGEGRRTGRHPGELR